MLLLDLVWIGKLLDHAVFLADRSKKSVTAVTYEPISYLKYNFATIRSYNKSRHYITYISRIVARRTIGMIFLLGWKVIWDQQVASQPAGRIATANRGRPAAGRCQGDDGRLASPPRW